MTLSRALVTMIFSLTLFAPATLQAKPDQHLTEAPATSQTGDTADAKNASRPVKPAKREKAVKPKPKKMPPSARPTQVPELDGGSAGMALLVLGGMILLMRETRQRA